MSLPAPRVPAGLPQALATALAPVIAEYLKEPNAAIASLTERFDTLEQRLQHEGLTRSQARQIQKAVAQKVYEAAEGLNSTTAQHFANVYGSLKDKYNVGSYMDIPRDKFLQAMQLIASYDGSGRNWWHD